MYKKWTALAMTAALFSLAAEEGLVGYWPLNEGAGTVVKDLGPNKLDGTIVAPETVRWTEGRDGKALEFDGENGKAPYVFVPNLKNADLTKGMTVMCWVMPDKKQKREGQYYIVSDTRGIYGKGFLLLIHCRRLLLSGGDGNKTMYYANSVFGKNPIVPETWMHFAATHDGKQTFKVYIDGELAGVSEKQSGPLSQGLNALTIGSQFGYAPFLGKVSGVKLYSRTLTDAEILKAAKGSEE